MLLLATGLVMLMAGLRDIFAPSFLNMSLPVKSTFDIAMQFAAAAIFLISAAVFYKSRNQTRIKNG